MGKKAERFWESVPLKRMSAAQWEALCDGCGKCCLHKFEEAKTRRVHYTNVACRLLDLATCRCTDYANRSSLVSDCVSLAPEHIQDPYWLPTTCAYRLLRERQPLPSWHPLISGTPGSVLRSGNSICGRAISELEAGDPLHHLVDWVE